MSELIRPLLQSEQSQVRRPYFPFFDAIMRGVIDMNSVVVRPSHESVGVVISRGKLPQHNDAGVIEAGERITAVDLTHVIDATKGGIVLGPADKAAVNKETGEMNNRGLITLSTAREGEQGGHIKVLGMVLEATEAQWLKCPGSVHFVGGLAVFQFGLDAPTSFELTDRSESDGTITLSERKKQL